MRLTTTEGASLALGAAFAATQIVTPWPTLRVQAWTERAFLLGLVLIVVAIIAARSAWLAGGVGLASLSAEPRTLLAFCALGLAVAAISGVDARLRRGLAWMLSLSAGLQASYIVVQSFGYAGGEPTGTVGNRFLAGALIALGLPFIDAWCVLLLVVALLYTKSFVAVAAGALALGLRWPKWSPVVLVGSFLAALAIRSNRGDAALHVRLGTWRAGFLDWMQNAPWTGLGFSGWSERVPAFDVWVDPVQRMTHAHSDVLAWSYATGVLGCGVLFGFAQSLRLRDRQVTAALAALALLTLVAFPFHAAPTSCAGAIILGLGLNAHEGA